MFLSFKSQKITTILGKKYVNIKWKKKKNLPNKLFCKRNGHSK
jgi:hypothetical protein